ncbi:MAG TPA: hypothetical protein VE173_06850, partial [Longimicrobiales bacterium]|nr:hypothetical protein [Longimicrobiales bacterium]
EHRMAILGAGPIGLECLLRFRLADWEADVYESGRVGENIRRWGHVRMFSPWRMNVSEPGLEVTRPEGIDFDALPTGREYVTSYLEPLAASPLLADHVHTGAEVVAVSRGAYLKGEEIGSEARNRPPFRILLNDARGERVVTADVVIDASGTFATHNWLGPGGIPAVGEREIEGVEYRLPDIEGRDRARFAGRRTLVVGAGHSAATAVVALEGLAREAEETRVFWLTRTDDERPVTEVVEDPLPERARIAEAANRVAVDGEGWLERISGSCVHGLGRGDDAYLVKVGRDGPERDVSVDSVLALVGYRPDPALVRELQVQTCWATEGTYPLAAALLSQEGGAADCLTAGADLDAGTLRHPEPRFFTLGAKSYGRNPNFLLATGFRQVEDLFGLLQSEMD